MPGVLVDQQSFPSFVDPHVFSPLFDDYHPPSPPLPRSLPPPDDLPRVSSPLKPQPSIACDPGADDRRSSAFRSLQSTLSLSALHGFDGFGTPPPSPSDRSGGSPRVPNFDAREEFGRKVFSRSLSKLGAQGLVAVNEDLVLQDASLFEGGALCEGGGGGGDVSSPLHLTGRDSELIGGVPIPLSGAYASSPRGGGGAFVGSPVLPDAISALQKYLPSNNEDEEFWPPQADSWPPLGNVYSCDEFRMYEFKVRKCMRGRSHDWTECPFAHPGEKARRRDPRRFHYSGIACPDFRKGSCRRGDACEYAHGVFECWLHPARYRTQPCKDGRNCKRRVCFFAHTNEQLRFLPGSVQSIGSCSSSSRANLHSSSLKASLGGSYDGSPLRQALAGSFDGAMAFESMSCLGPNGFFDGAMEGRATGSPRSPHLGFIGKSAHELCANSSQISSPTSTLVGHSHSPPPLSPPLSPSGSPPMSPEPSSSWPTAFTRSFSCLSAPPATIQQPLSPASFQGPFSQAALSHVQASMAASTQNSGCLSINTNAGPSPLSSTIPAHRRHLDRLQSMPTISIPLFEGKETTYMASPVPVSKELHCTQAMTDLIATLQQLDMRARTAEAANRVPAHWSPRGPSLQQHHLSQSVPCTPTKARWVGQIDPWEVRGGEEEVPVERVESGRDLRAKIYGRLGKECLVENESPNVDWVNELVK